MDKADRTLTGDRPASEDATTLGQTDFASDVMGKNSLQGEDQERVQNQRQAVPDVKLEPDADPVESAKMQDKDARAEAELNKGGGVHPGAAQPEAEK